MTLRNKLDHLSRALKKKKKDFGVFATKALLLVVTDATNKLKKMKSSVITIKTSFLSH
jgi:hypothetical protein